MPPSLTEWPRSATAARIGPFRRLPALFRLAWAAIPALMLYVAKFVVDSVVAGRAAAALASASVYFASSALRQVALLVGAELALALASILLGSA